MNENMNGVILFAHGSRDAAWHEPMQAIARVIGDLEPGLHVVCAYLEFTQPDFAAAARDLVMKGVGTVGVVPLFLGVGRHARDDLPRLVDEARLVHPGVRFELRRAIGEEASLIDLVAKIAIRDV